MSCWSYITGVIRVSTPARTTEQAEYILKTVLNHLPQVTGSEKNMQIGISCSTSSSCSQDWDEFGERTNKLVGESFEIYPSFLLTIEGNLRDREVSETHREFVRWLCRLAKRIGVDDICVKISDHIIKEIIITNPTPYSAMYEIPPRWVEQIEGPKWWEEIERKKTVYTQA